MYELKSNETSRTREVIFILGKNQNFKFDPVSSNIKIKNLKKIICLAANIKKNELKIFLKGEDFTDQIDKSLAEISPEDKTVEFTVIIENEIKEAKKDKKIGQICNKHNLKFTYLYCYDCCKSVCLTCRDEVHSTHKLFEKYDYMQSSKTLVDLIFKNVFLSSIVENDKKKEAVELKRQISENYIPELINIIKSTEKKQLELIDLYINTTNISFSEIKKNFDSLKNESIAALDEIKLDLDVEKCLMINDEVFILMDKKYKEISEDANELKNYQIKCDQVFNQFDNIKSLVEKFHSKHSLSLKKYFDDESYLELKKNILLSTLENADRDTDQVFEKLLSDFKVIQKERQFMVNSSSNKLSPREKINKTKSYNGEKIKNSAEQINLELNETLTFNNNIDLFSNSNNVINFLVVQNEYNNTVPASIPVSNESGNENNLKKTGIKKKWEINSKESNDLNKIIMRPIPGTNKIVIYDDNKKQIQSKTIQFPNLFPTKEFLNLCAWVNIPGTGKLYIGGGQTSSGQASNLFLCYSFLDEIIFKLSDMNYPRFSHSMCYHNHAIYFVGGNKNSTTEKYDIIGMKWSKLGNLNYEEKQNTILLMNNLYLYSFFGYHQGSYLDQVERLKINNPKAKWEFVPYKNHQKINLKIMGCGVFNRNYDNCVYFIGGKGKTEKRKMGFYFDFNTSSFHTSGIEIEDFAFFQENQLIKLENEYFGQFDNEQGDHFLKFNLDS